MVIFLKTKAELIKLIKIYVDKNYEPKIEMPHIRYCLSDLSDNDELDDETYSPSNPTADNFMATLNMLEYQEEVKCPSKRLKRKKTNDVPLYPQKYIERDIRYITSKLETTWCSEVFWIIDENHFKDSEVYKRAGISKQTFSKFRMDINYRPKRDTALQMCIGLKLNLDQSIDLLSKAGFTLSNASKRDLVVKYFINHEIYDINELNEILYEFHLELFNIN